MKKITYDLDEIRSRYRKLLEEQELKSLEDDKTTDKASPTEAHVHNREWSPFNDIARELLEGYPMGVHEQDLVSGLKEKGLTMKPRDLLSVPGVVRIGESWFLRELTARTVYIKYSGSLSGRPEFEVVAPGIWRTEVGDHLLDLYKGFGENDMILDDSVKSFLDRLYSPAEREKKEILEDLEGLFR